MSGLEFRLPWVGNRRKWDSAQPTDRPIAGQVDYDAGQNRYFVNQSRIPWWRWFEQELTFRQLFVSWPFIQGRVLEIGLGHRPFWLFFHHLSRHYVSLDFSALHPETQTTNLSLDPQNLPLKSEHLDTVVLWKVLRLVQNPSQFLEQVVAALRTDGHLIVLVSHEWGDGKSTPLPHDFSPGDLRKWLASLGLQVEFEQNFTGRQISLLQKWNAWVGRHPKVQKSPRFLVRTILLAEKVYLNRWQKRNAAAPSGDAPQEPLATLLVGCKTSQV